MAKLSAHGTHLQIEYIDCKLAVCSDGHLLKNHGDGWKLWRKLKHGIDWRAHHENRMAKLHDLLAERPVFAAYRRLLLQWKLEERQRIILAFDLLSDDIDGIWSELTDSWPRVDIDLDEIRDLYHHSRAVKLENERLNVQAPAAPPAAPAIPSALQDF